MTSLPILSDNYRLERELGGGGMSRVFVATEKALGRSVVIKLLPRELAGGVNHERFRNEIQVLAQLQHPLIVPLLAAGETQEQLWYVMPFIQGTSLKERLDQGPVPLEDAIRWLTDVAEALAYAHQRGIVHRDVKPGNVMLTAGRAVVTDFGVAKAVTDAARSGEHGAGLTTLGVALGTPAYMAPEQAAADPDTDHRADLYALGCMAYELLTGKPPFTGLPPAQLLAAHVATPPVPVLQRAPATPPALADLVMRLLAKRPADRPQSAGEVARLLAREIGPSGSGSGVSQPLMTLPVRGAVQALGIPVVLGGYAVLAAFLAWAVKGMAISTGLPDWALRAAYALLALVGVVLLAATFGALPRLRFRAFVVAALAAFALLGATAAGYGALREAGVGPMASLQGAGKLGERDPVLIADFANRTADSSLASVVTEAFRTDFTQSRAVRVLGPDAVAAALARMQRTAGTRLDAPLARELAQREGVKAVVEGEVQKLGASYLLSSRLVEPRTGEILAAFRETAANDGELIGAIDRLSKALREKIGESLRSIRSDGGLEAVTTASLPALRKYTEALRVARDPSLESLPRELALLREAVALDSTFAMAWRRLGVRSLGFLTERPEEGLAALSTAFRLRERLSPRERLLTEASYANSVQQDPVAAMRAYEGVLALDPDDRIALNNVTVLYQSRGETARQLVTASRLLALDSATSPGSAMRALSWMVDAHYALGQLDQARRLRRDYAARYGTRPGAANQLAAWLVLEHQHDSASAVLQTALAQPGVAGTTRGNILGAQAGEAFRRGRFTDAVRLVREAGAMLIAFDSSFTAQIVRQQVVIPPVVRLWYAEDPAGGLVELERALKDPRLLALPPERRSLDDFAWLYALAGKPDRAEALLAEYRRVQLARATPLTRRQVEEDVTRSVRITSAYLLASRGKLAEAQDSLRRQLAATPGYRLRTLAALGWLTARGGGPSQADSALAWLEEVRSSMDPERLTVDGDFGVPVLEELGRLYEARGERQKAAAAYQELIDRWRDADAVVQPRVRRAKEALARVTGEGASARN